MRGKGAASGIGAFVVAVVLVAGLTACVGGPPAPTPTASAATPSPGETAPPEPAIDLGGTAAQNQEYFDQVNAATIATGLTDGRSFIDALVVAGYSKESMEVTPDRTTANEKADSIQFSVRLNGTCLIGQYGGAGYGSFAGPLLASGHCLVGTTRPIDW